MLVYGLQHVMSMYAGVVAVPLIVGSALKLPFSDLSYLLAATLLISGLATLLQTLGVPWIGAKLPIVQGTSFAAVGSMIAIGAGAGGGTAGLQAIFGSIVIAGAIGFLLSGVFSRLLRFFPPVVTGRSSRSSGSRCCRSPCVGQRAEQVAMISGRWRTSDWPAITLAIILLVYRFLPGFFSRIAILIGLVAGGVVAAIFGMIDFAPVSEAQGFAISTPFHFGAPTFQAAAIVSMVIVMLVIMTETTADLLAIGVVVGRPADRRTVANGLRADTLSTAVSGGLLNGFPVSAFAQNVGLVALTGIKSRFVVAVSGGILLVLGLFPKVGAIIAALPLPVLGGAGLALFGTVAASGIRSSAVHYEGNQNLVIVALSISMGILPIAIRTSTTSSVVVPDDLRLRHQRGCGDGGAVKHPVQRHALRREALIGAEGLDALRQTRRGRARRAVNGSTASRRRARGGAGRRRGGGLVERPERRTRPSAKFMRRSCCRPVTPARVWSASSILRHGAEAQADEPRPGPRRTAALGLGGDDLEWWACSSC